MLHSSFLHYLNNAPCGTIHSILVCTSQFPHDAEKASTSPVYRQLVAAAPGWQWQSFVLENTHVFRGKLLRCHHRCAIIRYSCWEPYSASQASSSHIPSCYCPNDVCLCGYFPFQLRLVPSPLEGVAVCTETSTWITDLQLLADGLCGRTSSVPLVNSQSDLGEEAIGAKHTRYRPHLGNLWCWSTLVELLSVLD